MTRDGRGARDSERLSATSAQARPANMRRCLLSALSIALPAFELVANGRLQMVQGDPYRMASQLLIATK